MTRKNRGVTLVSCTRLPRPDWDDAPVRAALAALGVAARTVAWDDPAVDWGASPVTVIRSTWNYVQSYPAYLAWAERCASVSSLWNPLPIIRWNSHKSYLLELGARGLPIAPTKLVAKGMPSVSLAATAGAWSTVVIKPAVSAGSFATMRCSRSPREGFATFDEGQAHLATMLPTHDMLVQEYIPEVEGHGERSLIWIDGQITHAVRKTPRYRGDSEHASQAVSISPDEHRLAARVMSAIPRSCPLLYARIDMVPDGHGKPMLMELELIEPALYLDRSPPSVQRFAASVAKLLQSL